MLILIAFGDIESWFNRKMVEVASCNDSISSIVPFGKKKRIEKKKKKRKKDEKKKKKKKRKREKERKKRKKEDPKKPGPQRINALFAEG